MVRTRNCGLQANLLVVNDLASSAGYRVRRMGSSSIGTISCHRSYSYIADIA